MTMPAPRDRAALVKAARMYFLDNRSQDDVARALGTSRSNVSRMLSAARAQGIVEIRVHDQISREKDLEQALDERFHLEHVQVAAFRPGVDIIRHRDADSYERSLPSRPALLHSTCGLVAPSRQRFGEFKLRGRFRV